MTELMISVISYNSALASIPAATRNDRMDDATGPTVSKTDAILDAARNLYARYGYRRTSMEDIAREAGIAKGTVYLYFAGKEAVFRGMQARRVEELSARCDEAEQVEGDFGARLLALIEAQFLGIQENMAKSAHMLELGVTSMTVGAEILAAGHLAYSKRLTGMIGRACDSGEIDLAPSGLTPAALAESIISAATGARYVDGRAADMKAYGQSLKNLAALVSAGVEPR